MNTTSATAAQMSSAPLRLRREVRARQLDGALFSSRARMHEHRETRLCSPPAPRQGTSSTSARGASPEPCMTICAHASVRSSAAAVILRRTMRTTAGSSTVSPSTTSGSARSLVSSMRSGTSSTKRAGTIPALRRVSVHPVRGDKNPVNSLIKTVSGGPFFATRAYLLGATPASAAAAVYLASYRRILGGKQYHAATVISRSWRAKH